MDITRTPPETIMEFTRKGLASHRGRLTDLAVAADVPRDTLIKIRQGVTTNPRLSTIVPIVQCLQNFRDFGEFLPPKDRQAKRRVRRVETIED